jgi:glucokinase
MKILAGDIGGTKTLLQILRLDESSLNVTALHEQRFDSQAYSNFEDLLKEFIDSCDNQLEQTIRAACIGVAGPVSDTIAEVTNLPWRIDSQSLQQIFDIASVRLINDFQAVGYGISSLSDTDISVLQNGMYQDQGIRAVIGAGTGLGQGILTWRDNYYDVMASEGGHVDFAPVDEEQIQLLQYLKQQFDHVTYERLVSGPGLCNIYAFISSLHPEQESPELRQAMRSGDQAAAITQFSTNNKDPLAVAAMKLFISIYGAQAGNLALTCLPYGGLYVAGGIAPHIIDKLQDGCFIEAFCNKSKMQDLMSKIPVKVITNPQVGLMGAVNVAKRLATIPPLP